VGVPDPRDGTAGEVAPVTRLGVGLGFEELVATGVGDMVGVWLGVAVPRHDPPGIATILSFTRARQPLKMVSAATAILVCEPSTLIVSRTNVWVPRG